MLRIVLVLVLSLPLLALADEEGPQEADNAKDHPAVKRYPGTRETQLEEKEFEKIQLPVGAGKDQPFEGRFFHAQYWLGSKLTCTQFMGNYVNAFKTAGLKLIQGKVEELGDGFNENNLNMNAGDWITGLGHVNGKGPDLAITITCENNLHEGNVLVVERGQMAQKVELSAEGLASEIESSGHVAVYGIKFATGKADIAPASAKVLEQIAALLKNKPDWKLRIEGHTDNVGKGTANLELSKKRAASVKAWLVKSGGVDASRLTTEGYGDGKPVDSNDTEAGRAKNRRVELAKI